MRLQPLEQPGQLIAVNVGNKVKSLSRRGKFVQRQHRHLRPEVRAADADVDNVGDRVIGAHLLRVSQHRVHCGVHLQRFICYAFDSCLRLL